MTIADNPVTCATCKEGRASTSERVACAMLNSDQKLRAIAGHRIRTRAEVLAVITSILPPHAALYTGWAYLDSPYSKSGTQTEPSPPLVTAGYLLDPSSSCPYARKT